MQKITRESETIIKQERPLNNINSKTNSNSNIRSYLDPRTSKMNGSQNLRNYINSGLIINDNGKNSPKSSPSRRYYNDPHTNNNDNSWGLSGRNGNVNSPRNSTSRSSSNWVNPPSTRSSGSSSSVGRSYNYSSSSSSGISTNRRKIFIKFLQIWSSYRLSMIYRLFFYFSV